MRKRLIFNLLIIVTLVFPGLAFARQGDCGYEGGISAEQASYKVTQGKSSFDYMELCILSGKPVVFKGTLTITKSLKKDVITAKYDYNLTNLDLAATLKRSLELTTTVTKMENGQTVEGSKLSKLPTESIKIGNITYTLKSYDFTRSRIIDSKPAIDYYAGNMNEKKTYQISGGAGTTAATATTGTITLEETGSFYGYDQYWGSTEVQTLDYVIQSEQKKGTTTDKWGGTSKVNLSSTMTRQLKYAENKPDQISFSGGYLELQHNESIMEYQTNIPLFDANGKATDTIDVKKDSLKLETFPLQRRLPVANLKQLKGHWAEKEINIMYSLGIFKGNDSIFNPQQYITRKEFAAAILEAAKEVPIDPAFVPKTTTTKKPTATQTVSIFSDVSPENLYVDVINTVFKRGLMTGTSMTNFSPDGYVTISDALAVFIRALGLESLAPNPTPVTTFKDNDKIPSYQRNAAYVAEKIGLIKADAKGNLNPNEKLTKGKAAILLNSFINYMRDDIRKDYRDRIVNY